MSSRDKKILDFCAIQLQLLKEKEGSLRKEILNCKLQHEFLTSLVRDLSDTGGEIEQ